MWVPKAEPQKTEAQVPAPQKQANPDAMELDAIMKDHVIVPQREWDEYMKMKTASKESAFFDGQRK